MVSKKIPFENLNNVRDLGGMVTADGRRVKEGMLLRSGRLFEASEDDKKRLAQMVDLILDFRSKDEVDKTPDPQLDGVEYIHMSIYDDSFRPDRHIEKTEIDPEGRPLHDGERTRRSMCSMYLQFAENEYAKSQFEFFLRKLLSGNYHCVLWHCTAGKDRTGIGAAILQKILGIPYEDIIEDYMLTNEYMGPEVEQAKKEFFEQYGYLTEENEKSLEYLHRTHPSYVDTVMTRIDELYGNFDNYITQGLHISEEEKEQLRQMYLD